MQPERRFLMLKPMKATLAAAGLAALLGGCATTVEMGPGYYRYDTRVSTAPGVVVRERAVVYREPTTTYREPVVYYER
jgi:hypothetical protein